MKAGTAIAPTAGLNEMLSALLAVRALAPLLPERTLIRIAAAIESTIPFRGPSPEGEDPTERLRQVLDEVSRKFALGLRPDDLDAAVADGVELANRDVANCAFDDPAKFLDNTWSLLPETNWSLRVHSVYSARDYRTAMERMEGFLSHLDAERVFRAYHGQPPAAALAGPIARARRNVDTGARYLGAKLAASCLLDALAQLTGGDAPVALLMGDLPTDEDAAMRMEQFLPAGAPTANDDVWRLLAEGRASPSGFDLKNAPLAAYLYSTLPGLSEAVQRSRSYCAGGLSAEELLRTFPTQVVAEIARACAQVAFFRREPLLALAARFSPTV
jgi:hypothetical protein